MQFECERTPADEYYVTASPLKSITYFDPLLIHVIGRNYVYNVAPPPNTLSRDHVVTRLRHIHQQESIWLFAIQAVQG